MKRILSIFLCLSLILTGCSTSSNNDETIINLEDYFNQNDIDVNEFKSMSNPEFLQYVEDDIYSNIELKLDDNYHIENVATSFISQEYIDELNYNSQSNIFFGYTLNELNEYFNESKYIFTMDENGNTTVQELSVIEDVSMESILKNVAIGGGVILVCVTVSCVTGGAGIPTAVNIIFATAAKTATSYALSSAVIGGASAGIVRGIQTGDMAEVIEAAMLSGSEGFKWGAISGAVVGGISSSLKIYRSSKVQPTPRQSEIDVCKMTKNGEEQVSFLNGKEVANGTSGSTRPDVIVRNANGTVKAIEVKNYNLKDLNCRSSMINKLKKQVQDRLLHLPEGSTQEIVLDVRGRGYDDLFVKYMKLLIEQQLKDFENITVTMLRY